MNSSDIADIEKTYQKRLESMLAVDESIEAVVDTLREMGQLDNTVIIYTSDNGFFHGEHRRPHGKRLVYEESIRVPLLMRGPGVPQSETRSQLVSNVDLAATLVDIAGAQAGRNLDGRSLMSVAESSGALWRNVVFMEAGNKLSFFPSNDTTLHGIYRAVRTPSYVYAEHETPGGNIEKELYDLNVDPHQLESKHNDNRYQPVINDMKDKLATLRSCSGSGCWVNQAEAEPTPSEDTTSPSTPTDVSATAVSPSRIDITWNTSTDNVGVSGYNIFRTGNKIASISGTSYTDAGLTENTTYTYAVSAYDAAGNESGTSATVSATTLKNDSEDSENGTPFISDVSPSSGPIGTTVTLSGNNFTANNNHIHFGQGYLNNEKASTAYSLPFVVPSGLSPCPHDAEVCPQSFIQTTSGTYDISVENENGTSNTVQFTVTDDEKRGASQQPVQPFLSPLTQSQIQSILNLLSSFGADQATIDNVDGALRGEATPGDGGGGTGGSCSYTFTQNLTTGSTGTEVMKLQKFLNMDPDTQLASSGPGSPGNETSYFGSITKSGVVKFQNKYKADVLTPVGLSTGTGYWGPSSRKKANMVCGLR